MFQRFVATQSYSFDFLDRHSLSEDYDSSSDHCMPYFENSGFYDGVNSDFSGREL